MLCFSSKKSAVYAGYKLIGSKPSWGWRGELVHSQTPPMAERPRRDVEDVTGMGCQCWKLLESGGRSMNSSVELPSTWSEGWDGGVSSTPLLTRCLGVHCQSSQKGPIRYTGSKEGTYALTAGTLRVNLLFPSDTARRCIST